MSGTRGVLAYLARPFAAEPLDGSTVDTTPSGFQRHDDVVEACSAGLVLVAGGFTHPVHCERYVGRAAATPGWRIHAVGLAIWPAHGDEVDALVAAASACCSERSACLEPPPSRAAGPGTWHPARA